MSSVFQYEDMVSKYVWVPVLLVAIILVLLLGIAAPAILDRNSRDDKQSPSVAWIQGQPVSAEGWESFLGSGSASGAAGSGALAKRFRLAGTFFLLDSAQEARKAILDDLKTGKQAIVAQGEHFDDVSVVGVLNDHVVLRAGDGTEEQLWLTFSKTGMAGGGKPTGTGTNQMELTGLDRFGGKRVGELSWVYSRKSLLDYYGELRNEPERLAAVFDTFAPEYDASRKITGYRIKIQGEREFINSIGLKESDVVRSVNTMKMTSRTRAEMFISEFVQDRLNVVTVEVERDGKPMTLNYKVR